MCDVEDDGALINIRDGKFQSADIAYRDETAVIMRCFVWLNILGIRESHVTGTVAK